MFASFPDPHSCLPGVHVGLPQVGDPCVQVMMEFGGHAKTTNSSTLTTCAALSITETAFQMLEELPVADCRSMPEPGVFLITDAKKENKRNQHDLTNHTKSGSPTKRVEMFLPCVKLEWAAP